MQEKLFKLLRNYKERTDEIENKKEKKRYEELKQLFDEIFSSVILEDEMAEIRNEKLFKKVFSKKIKLDEKVCDKYNIYIDDTGYKEFNAYYNEEIREVTYMLEDKINEDLYGLDFSYYASEINTNSYLSNLLKIDKINVCFFKVETINELSLIYNTGSLSNVNYKLREEITSLKYENLNKYLKETTVTLKHEYDYFEKKTDFKDIGSYLENIFAHKAYSSILNNNVDIYTETFIFEGINIHVYAVKEIDDVVFDVFDGKDHICDTCIPQEVVSINFSICIPKSGNIVDRNITITIPKSFTTKLYDLVKDE